MMTVENDLIVCWFDLIISSSLAREQEDSELQNGCLIISGSRLDSAFEVQKSSSNISCLRRKWRKSQQIISEIAML